MNIGLSSSCGAGGACGSSGP
nr:hypothetical protein [Tanacetum cinerariifolium]